MFNCKIIEKIKLTKKFILDVLSNKLAIDEWVVDKCAFIEFLSNKEEIEANLFKDFVLHLYSKGLYDLEKLLKELEAHNSPNTKQLRNIIGIIQNDS